jgi:hypothetical protein
VRAWIESELEVRVAPLRGYAEAIAAQATPAAGSGRTRPALTAAAVEELQTRARALIEHSPAHIGAGFIAAPSTVDDRPRYMAWLHRRNGAIRRLRLNFDSSDVDAYDYIGMDWYVRTRHSRRANLTGPFLDYSGSDTLVLTLALPVVADDDFRGVAAIDLMAQAAEEDITNQLCSLPAEAVVVNHERTIVATNSVRWMPGERVAVMPSTDPAHYEYALPIAAWTRWQLAVARSLEA